MYRFNINWLFFISFYKANAKYIRLMTTIARLKVKEISRLTKKAVEYGD